MLPSGATSTAVTAAHGAPLGGWPQSRTVWKGFGRTLMGWTSFAAKALATENTIAARAIRCSMGNLLTVPGLYYFGRELDARAVDSLYRSAAECAGLDAPSGKS